MSLFDIYYITLIIVSWIGCLVYVELEKDGNFDYMYELDEDFPIIIFTHMLIVVFSLLLPLIWPIILLYFVIRIIVKSIAKIIKMHRKEKLNKGE